MKTDQSGHSSSMISVCYSYWAGAARDPKFINDNRKASDQIEQDNLSLHSITHASVIV